MITSNDALPEPTGLAEPKGSGPTGEDRSIRTLFISDVHLGSPYAQVGPLVDFLHSCRPEYVYLVGDFFDGWRLKRRWLWKPEYTAVLRRLTELAAGGTRIRYTPGNHDEFLRTFLHDYRFVEVRDEFIHRLADGRRVLVLHGDRFEDRASDSRWVATLGANGYDLLMWIDHRLGQALRRLGRDPLQLSLRVKYRLKRVLEFVAEFENAVAKHARSRGCEGLVCGHIHMPIICELEGLLYCNSGDWIEHCSALVEYANGELDLRYASGKTARATRAFRWSAKAPGPDLVPAG